MRDPNRIVRVYGLYDTRDPEKQIRYVGVTVQELKHRLRSHTLGAERSGSGPVSVWIREIYGQVGIAQLDQCTWTDRHSREEHWIAQKRTLAALGEGGLNDSLGQRKSESWRAKQSAAWQNADVRSRRRSSLSASRTQAANDKSAQLLRIWWQDAEYRAMRIEGARRGGRLSSHTRNHVRRGVIKPGCEFCEES